MAAQSALRSARRGRTAPAARGADARTPTVAAVVATLAAFAALGWVRRWNGDDAFIVFRVVGNVLAGDGIVYNVGERVEAVTSPLWLAVLASARVILPVAVEWLAVVLGLRSQLPGWRVR